MSGFAFMFFVFFAVYGAFAALPLASRIEGLVYSPERNPVENAVVELINEVDSVIARTKTTSNGRFTFTGNYRGRYNIRVSPFGTNFRAQTQEISVGGINRSGNDIVYTDIYLAYDKAPVAVSNKKSAETIFVQDVPPAAQKLFDEAIENFKKNENQGVAKLEEAIIVFPQYFAALNLLGEKYVSLKNYEKAAFYSAQAVAINPRSSIDFYRLGISHYRMKKYPEALEPSQSAVTLAPGSIETQLLYGTVLRINNRHSEAEKALLKANSLAKSKNADVYWQLALLYNRQNRNQEAVNALETFLKISPEDADRKNIEELIVKLKASIAKAK